jgi:hypothetical protein
LAKRLKKKGKKEKTYLSWRFGEFVVRRVSAAEVARFCEEPPEGAIVYGRDQLAFMGRIADVIDRFEREVCGHTAPSPMAILMSGAIGDQLWSRHGARGDWAQLDVDDILDLHRGLGHEMEVGLHLGLLSLITWLANNGHLERTRAIDLLRQLDLREPREVTAMRARVAALPPEEHARSERDRLARRERMRLDARNLS